MHSSTSVLLTLCRTLDVVDGHHEDRAPASWSRSQLSHRQRNQGFRGEPHESAPLSPSKYYRRPFDGFDGGCPWPFYGLALNDDSRKKRGRSMRMLGQVTLTPARTSVWSSGDAS